MMTTKITTRTAAGALCVLAATTGITQAEVYTLEMHGVVDQFGFGFGGADRFPFAGLASGDALLFHFEYDLNTLPTDVEPGGVARYSFDGAGSYVRLGANTVAFDGFSVVVGSTDSGSMVIGFSGFTSSFSGFSAGFTIEGAGALPTDLPTAIDVNDFTWARNSAANSDLNSFLLPIVMGSVDLITITPAPSGALVLLSGGLLAARRRRKA